MDSKLLDSFCQVVRFSYKNLIVGVCSASTFVQRDCGVVSPLHQLNNFIYVLSLSTVPHWICISKINRQCFYIDSDPPTDSSNIESNLLKKFLLDFGFPLTILEDRKLQSRSNSCGLFALYASICVASGEDVVYAFDQFKLISEDNELFILRFLQKWIHHFALQI